MMSDYCECGHHSEIHDDAGKCFGKVQRYSIEEDGEPCRCKRFVARQSQERK